MLHLLNPNKMGCTQYRKIPNLGMFLTKQLPTHIIAGFQRTVPLKIPASHAALCRELRRQMGYVRFLCASRFKHQLPLYFEADERVRWGRVICPSTASDSMSVVRAADNQVNKKLKAYK